MVPLLGSCLAIIVVEATLDCTLLCDMVLEEFRTRWDLDVEMVGSSSSP